jgi:hypothetical protein
MSMPAAGEPMPIIPPPAGSKSLSEPSAGAASGIRARQRERTANLDNWHIWMVRLAALSSDPQGTARHCLESSRQRAAPPGAAAESRAVARIFALTTGDQIDPRSDRNVPIGHDRAFIDCAVCVRGGKGRVDDRGITVQTSRHACEKRKRHNTRAIQSDATPALDRRQIVGDFSGDILPTVLTNPFAPSTAGPDHIEWIK